MDESCPSVEHAVNVPDNLVEELVSALHDSVHIVGDHSIGQRFGWGEEFNDCGGSKITSNQKQWSRCESLSSPRKMRSNLFSNEDEEEPESTLKELFSEEHAPLKLVSAMKGSRRKEETTHGKLRVTWAPDVYDPLPMSLSHTVRRGIRHQVSRKDKRNGKKGHKGKDSSQRCGTKDPSNGAGGKDKKKKKKKHYGETSVSSNTCFKLPHTGNGILDFKPEQVEGYGMGILDASCGGSFLKLTLTNGHYPVSEAL